LSKKFLSALKAAAGRENTQTNPALLKLYASDASKRKQTPLALVRGVSSAQIAKILTVCSAHKTPVVPRGAGSGLTGGAIPAHGGIVLDLSAMNAYSLLPEHRLLIAQAGTLVGEIKQAAAQAGLFYPPDPSSAAFATIGGSIAENAGGLRAVKYGVTADYVLGMTVALMNGEIIKLGGRTTKSVVGYNLTRLMSGSEGTLGVITEATLRLLPQPEAINALSACFSSAAAALELVAAINRQPIVPTALEFMDAATLRAVSEDMEVPAGAKAMLLLEIDGPSEVVERQRPQLQQMLRAGGAFAMQSASTPEQAASLWRTRRGASQAMFRLGSHKLNQDIALPLGELSNFLDKIEKIETDLGVKTATFGHAGDGNLHVNIMYMGDDPQQAALAQKAVTHLFARTLRAQGSVSGEHGVGITKLAGARLEIDPSALDIMWRIKEIFDPANLLNPGKALPPL
jgi:glycolate oxidase subunit GlcD